MRKIEYLLQLFAAWITTKKGFSSFLLYIALSVLLGCFLAGVYYLIKALSFVP